MSAEDYNKAVHDAMTKYIKATKDMAGAGIAPDQTIIGAAAFLHKSIKTFAEVFGYDEAHALSMAVLQVISEAIPCQCSKCLGKDETKH